ncbi:MAG TPA: hypothetical protein VG821_12265 [Rhizomicrobium sp.]|nr:hypothetical protein [Rhizomicrobium sp.]
MSQAGSRLHLLVVSTVSYMPQALTALRSARHNGRYAGTFLFVADATPSSLATIRDALVAEPGLRVFGPHELTNGRDAFLRVFNYYNAFEVANVAKYVGVSQVLSQLRDGDVCIYADADTFFISDLGNAIAEMGSRGILLTPHQFSPSDDGHEHEYLLNGWLNSGFSAFVRGDPGARLALDWLTDRVGKRGYLATQYGMSGDQPWLSACPYLFPDDCFVSHNAGLNVAYWNIGERHLERTGSAVLANGVPLLFLHFSGFKPEDRGKLSVHAEMEVGVGTVLSELCDLYRAELAAAGADIAKIGQLEVIRSAQTSLTQRLLLGEIHNDINLAATTAKSGPFTRIGRRIDFYLNKALN